MRLYKDANFYDVKNSILDNKKGKDKCNRFISALMAFGIFCNIMSISTSIKYQIERSNPFEGQRLSSSDFITNYKFIKSKSFIEDESFKDIIESIKNNDIDKKKAYLLYYALISNEFLTKEEKKKLTGYLQYFVDNKYLDYEYVYNKLSSFVVKQNDETMYNKGLAGVYDRSNNSIKFANDESRDYAASHEIFHSESKQEGNHYVPIWFEEGLTDLLSYEYNNTQISYDVEVTFCRILCELVGSDVLFETRAKGDINILINTLVKYGIPKEKVEVLFELFNEYRWERKQENPDFDSLRIKIIDQLRDCYLDINPNNEDVNPMFYEHILYISNLQYCDSNIKYYFNSLKIKEMGIPTAIEEHFIAPSNHDQNLASSSKNTIKEEREYHDTYRLERRIERVEGTEKVNLRKSIIKKTDFNYSVDGIINAINGNRTKQK